MGGREARRLRMRSETRLARLGRLRTEPQPRPCRADQMHPHPHPSPSPPPSPRRPRARGRQGARVLRPRPGGGRRVSELKEATILPATPQIGSAYTALQKARAQAPPPRRRPDQWPPPTHPQPSTHLPNPSDPPPPTLRPTSPQPLRPTHPPPLQPSPTPQPPTHLPQPSPAADGTPCEWSHPASQPPLATAATLPSVHQVTELRGHRRRSAAWRCDALGCHPT